MEKKTTSTKIPYHYLGIGILAIALLSNVWDQLSSVEGKGIPVQAISEKAQSGLFYVCGGIILFFFLQTLRYLYYYYISRKRIRFFRIVPHIETESPKDTVLQMTKVFSNLQRTWWKRLLYGREWFRFMVHMGDDNEIKLFIGFPEDKYSGVQDALKDAYPYCELFEIPHEEVPFPTGKNAGYGGRFRYASIKKAGLPMKTYEKPEIGSLFAFLDSNTWLDLQFSPTSYARLQKQMKNSLKQIQLPITDLLQLFEKESAGPVMSNLDPDEYNRRKSIYKRYTGKEKPLEVAFYLWSENEKSDTVSQALNSKIISLSSEQNGLKLSRMLFFKKTRNAVRRLVPFPLRSIVMTGEEMATLFHLPNGDHPIYAGVHEDQTYRGQLTPILKGQELIPKTELNTGLSFGALLHPFYEERKVKIPLRNLTEMGFGAGKTGMGKSTFIVRAILDHLENDWYQNPNAAGMTLFDGKGDDYKKIVSKIMKDEQDGQKIDWSRIHVFDLSSDKYSLGLNLLHQNDGESPDVVVESALDVIKNAYPDRDSMLLDRFGKLALLSLLESKGTHSILGLEMMIRKDALFRKRIITMLQSELKQDWEEVKKELDNDRTTLPILNRMQNIRYNTRMKRMFGQPKSGLEIQKWMDEGHIVLFNLANLSEQERKMVIGYIITQYHRQCHIRKNKGKEHINFVDEFHLVQIPVVKQILSLDRSTGHCFFPMTQHTEQLDNDIMKAFDGNVGTILSCRVGSESAEKLKKMSGETLNPKDLQHLRRLTAVLTTSDSKGGQITTFLKADPQPLYKADGEPAYYGPDAKRQKKENEEAHLWISQKVEELMQRDCWSVEEVDKWIEKYLKVQTLNQEEAAVASQNHEEDEDDDDFIFE